MADLGVLRARLERATSGGEPGLVFEPATIAAARRVAALTEAHPDDDNVEAAYLLGLFHWLRYQQLPEELEEEDARAALAWFERVLPWWPDAVPPDLVEVVAEQAPPGGDDAAAWSSEAVRLLESAVVDSVAVLDRAVALLRSAVASAPVDHPGRAGYLANLGAALRDRFERTGQVADLEQAIGLGREAVATTPDGDPDRVGRLANLGGALQTRFERVGDLADIDQAITLLRLAVATARPDQSSRMVALSNLGGALRARFERVGELPDLDQAVAVLREAATADDPMYLSNLGGALQRRSERTGALDDLEQAIAALRQAVAGTPADHPDRAMYLSNLGGARRARFDRMGDLADLDQAIVDGRAAVAAAPADHPDRAMYLSNLGGALATRFERIGDLADLDEAVARLREALAATPLDHPERVGYLSNLGGALQTRFARVGDADDLEPAVAALREATTTIPIDHPDRPMYLSNLGITLRNRFEESTDPGDLDEAVSVLRAAVAATAVDHPDLAGRLFHLGSALRTRFERAADRGDRDDAIARLEQGAGLLSAPPAVRVRCAGALGRLLAGRDWAGASRAWDLVLELQPLVLDRALSRDDRQYLLHDFIDAGTAAAAARLALDDLTRAMEVLETGRGLLLGQALETATDPALRRARPELADQLDQVRHDLNLTPEATTLDVTELRRHAAARWTDLLATIRAEPGFERFGRPASLDTLRAAVVDGALVTVNVTAWRCDALILTAAGAQHLPLPGLTERAAVDQANRFLAAIEDPGLRSNQTMREVLRWLWDTVTGPVLDHLGHVLTPAPGQRWPRVWWSPTGPLTVLPLHAAGHHDDATGPTVLDRAISSYAPTARLLARAQAQAAATDGADSLDLIVGIGNAAGQPPLAFAAQEAADVHRQHGGGARLLVDADATLAAVRAGLTTSAMVHLACHGVPDVDPADSHLVLWDGALAVREIANLDLTDARLAYLSACTTAYGGTDLLDEAIHIASAFQVAGFAHVVATLWPITDRDAPRLAGDFYRQLRAGAPPAAAVHHAVRALRDDRRSAPYLWAPYVHLGP